MAVLPRATVWIPLLWHSVSVVKCRKRALHTQALRHDGPFHILGVLLDLLSGLEPAWLRSLLPTHDDKLLIFSDVPESIDSRPVQLSSQIRRLMRAINSIIKFKRLHDFILNKLGKRLILRVRPI